MPAGIPVLHLDGFDGPMDLLLDLAERQRVDFGRMSILALAEQFAAALEHLAGQVKVERRADWLVLAARLVLLRARLLFPASPEAAAAAEREAAAELRRLDERAVMRAAASWLDARPILGRDVFARPRRQRDPRTESWMALMEACLVLLRGGRGRPEDAAGARFVLPDLWRPADALAHIRTMLATDPQGSGLTAFLPPLEDDASDAGHRRLRVRAALASTLVAALELARDGEASVRQDAAFGAISLRAAVPLPDAQINL